MVEHTFAWKNDGRLKIMIGCGDITIADSVCIGAGAVVVKNVTVPGTTVVGVPAKAII